MRAALVGLDHLEAHRAVREILWAWDPIGVAGHAPRDEYDMLIEPVVGVRAGHVAGHPAGRAAAGADTATLTCWLCDRVEDHFGLRRPASPDAEREVADRLLRWWASRRRTSIPYSDPDPDSDSDSDQHS
jgi:hypothetical protein